MTAAVHHDREAVISVHNREDAPGYVVKCVLDERTARVPAETFEEANSLAESIRDLFALGIGDSIFTD